MRIADPYIMIVHVIVSLHVIVFLRGADVGLQSADTTKLAFRFFPPKRERR